MKKKIKTIASVILLLSLVGCGKVTKSQSITYKVETGDNIKITLDTTDGHKMTTKLPFEISKDGIIQTQGIFITAADYKEYLALFDKNSKNTITDSGERDGISYIHWIHNNSEYNYAILIKDSNTGVLLGNKVSEESAKECFNRLTFTLKK